MDSSVGPIFECPQCSIRRARLCHKKVCLHWNMQIGIPLWRHLVMCYCVWRHMPLTPSAPEHGGSPGRWSGCWHTELSAVFNKPWFNVMHTSPHLLELHISLCSLVLQVRFGRPHTLEINVHPPSDSRLVRRNEHPLLPGVVLPWKLTFNTSLQGPPHLFFPFLLPSMSAPLSASTSTSESLGESLFSV